MAVRLAVNVDHVATVRQARRAAWPDPVEAARIAEAAGAAGITVHLRVDRRHIQDHDVERLRGTVRGKLNLEMSTAAEMVALALRVKPDQVTLVAEQPHEVTTEGGLDLLSQGARVAVAAAELAAQGIEVSLFVDPDPRQIEAITALPDEAHEWISGFELNTDAYTRARDGEESAAELAKLARAGDLGCQLGFCLYAGHGLTTDNVGPVAALPGMEELNIGHFLIARAVLIGLDAAVREMLDAMAV